MLHKTRLKLTWCVQEPMHADRELQQRLCSTFLMIMALEVQHVQVVGCQLLTIGLIVSGMIHIGQP